MVRNLTVQVVSTDRGQIPLFELEARYKARLRALIQERDSLV